MTDSAGRRVAILGGGMASIAAAWRLSTTPGIGQITVYQRGWRLGGKGASSRGVNGRIEEHGLHVWLGYYDNAFRLMRECYTELDRDHLDPACPIRTWRDAFAPSDRVGLASRTTDGWTDWTALFTPNAALPGEPTVDAEPMSPLTYVLRAQRLLRDFVSSIDEGDADPGTVVLSASPTPPRRPMRIGLLLQRGLDAAVAIALETAQLATVGLGALPVAGPTRAATDQVIAGLASLSERLRPMALRTSGSRRMFELADLVLTSVRGILADGLLVDPRGFSAINGEEFRDWLLRHGAAPETFESPLVTGIYDLVFGYRDGDPALPRFAAGTGLFLSAKIFFDYKGSIFWKMQAGMGDVVFAPMYQVLRSRGVRFEFFHDVRALTVSADGRSVETVKLVRQVDLADARRAYEPLARVGGLPCFPAEPDAVQLRDGNVRDPERLETLWSRSDDSVAVELRRGEHFDELVYGLSLGMVEHTCADIVSRDLRWRQMVRQIGTVATQSVQLWMRPTEGELGWAHPGSTLTGFMKPFDTIASMSHLLDVEEWPGDDRPRSVFYLCNTLPEAPPPGPDAVGYLQTQTSRVRAHAVDFLNHGVAPLLPGAVAPDGFRWDLLVDEVGPLPGQAADRIDTQYYRANVDPSDRYVQSLPGTDRFRLRPDESGFDHLTLAGDWTDCGLNAGCIEAAVISGLQAANAVAGQPRWSGISGYWEPLEGR